jgi:polar amino acid transport system substrate-binding protein
MSMSTNRPGVRRVLPVLVATALAAAGCAYFPPRPVRPAPVQPIVVVPQGAQRYVGPTTTPSENHCTSSLRPAGPLPTAGSAAARAVLPLAAKRGHLVVGVDQNTLNWAYRDPADDSLRGFDVEMLREVALAMFGDRNRISFVVVPNANRAQAVRSGEVDIVAETMTITCGRQGIGKVKDRAKYPVDFSDVYYDASQLVLVPKSSSIKTEQDLAGKRVCATAGSTSIQRLASLHLAHPVQAWQVQNQTDCLVMLQQGQVDAISTDDTILAGLAAQDPQVKVLDFSLGKEPYGMAIAKSNPTFTRFVNAVLAQDRQNGTWATLWNTYLCPKGTNACSKVPAPPNPAPYKG